MGRNNDDAWLCWLCLLLRGNLDPHCVTTHWHQQEHQDYYQNAVTCCISRYGTILSHDKLLA